MSSSKTPSDLEVVIVRALDAACTNAADEISNGCLDRSFVNINELPRLLFRCATLATPRWNPLLANRGIAGSNCRVIIVPYSVGSFSRRMRIVQRAWAKARQRVIFLQHRIFGLIARTTAEFRHRKSPPLPNAKNLVQTYWLGIEHRREC
jgi:hypothetical protein